MKKLLLLLVCAGAFMFGGHVVLNASDSAQEEEEYYDEDEFGPEALIIWESPVRGVVFSHKTHTYEMGLSCEDCHDEIFEMEAGYAETEDDFNMEAMYEGNIAAPAMTVIWPLPPTPDAPPAISACAALPV